MQLHKGIFSAMCHYLQSFFPKKIILNELLTQNIGSALNFQAFYFFQNFKDLSEKKLRSRLYRDATTLQLWAEKKISFHLDKKID